MGVHKLIQLPDRIWRKLHAQGLILLYHRVATLDTDPQLLSVTPEHFAEHLEYLSDHYNPISLPELSLALKTRKIPDRSVVITFDDGYADNFWNAKPLLEKYGIPATVFVTSGSIGSDKEFWWDDLERLLLLPDELPGQLILNINGEELKWDLTGTLDNRTDGEDDTRLKSWNVTMASNPGPQYAVYRDLHRHLKPLPHEQQEYILASLAQWVGVSRTGRETHRPLTLNELRDLDRGGLIEIGAHTTTHSMLSMQPVDVQKEEIIQGKIALEKMLGHEVQSFSYPFGGRADFSMKTVEIVKEAGINTACVNYGSTLIRNSNPYLLPRALIRNWDIEFFSSQIMEWFDE